MKRIDHVGVAVRCIEEALRVYTEVLGLKLEGVETVADRGVRVAFLEVGPSHIELLEPTSPESAVAKFLEARGEGIHHLALQVDEIDRELEALRQAGLRLIDESPRPGARGTRIAFLHPKSTGGVLLELCERKVDGR